ncbi:MAG: DUF1592 domain-containing protein [Myxococcales bacterium]|nr:DUF1592 domain-containing protein [Myxococcales bacterium]
MRAIAIAGLWAALAIGCGGGDDGGDPGRVTLHRLNNAEYNNTVRDLLGTKLTPATDFPADDRGYGFDNVADVLRLSPLSLELYEGAAEALIADTLAVTTSTTTQMFEPMTDAASGAAQAGGWLFFSNGSSGHTVQAPIAGMYKISIRAYGQQAGPDPARMSIEVPNQAPIIIDVTAVAASPAIYESTVALPAGSSLVTVSFINDFYDAATMGDRNLWVDYVHVTGPLDGPQIDGTRRKRLLLCDALDDAGCQRSILEAFAKRAWRRPPTDEEIGKLLSLVELARAQGDTAEAGLRLALQGVLVSPHFIFRVEVDPNPGSLTPRPLTGWELATRLSYFLWSSMPDAELFDAAESGRLTDDPAELGRQAQRMLDDPKAIALTDNFAGQWLFTRARRSGSDYQLFPRVRRRARGRDACRDPALLPGVPQRGRADGSVPRRRLHVRERSARRVLWPAAGGLAHGSGPRLAGGFAAARLPHAGQLPPRDLAAEAHLAGAARQVGARQPAVHAAAPTTARRGGPAGCDDGHRLDPRAPRGAPQQPDLCELSPHDGSDRLRPR